MTFFLKTIINKLFFNIIQLNFKLIIYYENYFIIINIIFF